MPGGHRDSWIGRPQGRGVAAKSFQPTGFGARGLNRTRHGCREEAPQRPWMAERSFATRLRERAAGMEAGSERAAGGRR